LNLAVFTTDRVLTRHREEPVYELFWVRTDFQRIWILIILDLLKLESNIKAINLKQLIKDVNSFLINPDHIKRIELFPEFIKGLT
jgi:hypothetical protein